MKKAGYLSAKEAAEELGITLSTLYSYVSRGLIRSEAADRSKRTRRYRVEDVEKLKRRQEQRRNPAKLVEEALHWGAPVLDSAISLLSDNRLYYRGHDVLTLAADHSVEAVAALIWTGSLETEIPGLFEPDPTQLADRWPALVETLASYPPLTRFQMVLPLAATEDVAAYDLRPAAVAQTGARILQLMTALAAADSAAGGGIAQRLQQSWAADQPQAAALLQAALILCADHELNVSAFAARCVASAGATPYQAVIGGLAALQGVKHGRQTERVAALLREIERPEQAQAVLAGRLRRGEPIPGFGHRLYPEGDPRGRALLAMTQAAYPQAPAVLLVEQVVAAAADLLGEYPTIDLGLVTLAKALGLPPGGPLALFALGRTIGWIGHTIEAYDEDRIIRPRARYVGQPPAA